MYKTYQDIFNIRGLSYHKAMQNYPLARQDEFKNIIELSDFKDDNLILDIPSGGCYLSNFITHENSLISVETSTAFAQKIKLSNNIKLLICKSLNHINLPSNSADRILSLAALHHVEDKLSFYHEMSRLLKEEGIICIADVLRDSAVADFLNIFVDKYNSMGHQGDFICPKIREELTRLNFNVVFDDVISYPWYFDSVNDMVDFCQLLFGLDKGNDELIKTGIDKYLGYSIKRNKVLMNWQLYFVKAKKVGFS